MGHIDIPRPISATVSISVLIHGLTGESMVPGASIGEKDDRAEATKVPAVAPHAVRVELWNADQAGQVAMGTDELSVPCLVLAGPVNTALHR